MKVLVLGSTGMAGHMIAKYLTSAGHDVMTCSRTSGDYRLDIERMSYFTLQNFKFEFSKFDYVINCVGLLVNDSIGNPDKAILINGMFPHYLESLLKDTDTRIIHLSTDCVFDGVKGNYVESDIHTETNIYGRSKSIGEINNDKDVTFRMSIIGTDLDTNGTGLLNWMITNTNSTVNGWDNHMWNGMTTLQLAKCIDQYMNDPKFTGVYHMVNNNININKHDLLCLINDVFDCNKTIIRTQTPNTVNKILVDTREVAEYSIPEYTTQLVELRDFK